MSVEIKNTTQAASIPQDTASGSNQIEQNPYFAFMMALGVIPSEAQRSKYEALDQKVEVAKLEMDNLQVKLTDTMSTVTLDNIVEVNPEFLAIQQKMTEKKGVQDFVVSVNMPALANDIKGSQTMAYSNINSLLRVTGAPGRRVY